jgi:hypothetical protein
MAFFVSLGDGNYIVELPIIERRSHLQHECSRLIPGYAVPQTSLDRQHNRNQRHQEQHDDHRQGRPAHRMQHAYQIPVHGGLLLFRVRALLL